MSARSETMLWIAQRATAALLALCVVVHLATMIVAVRGGLTATEILGRTRGSVGWATFYGLFVLAVAIHAPIGLRTVARFRPAMDAVGDKSFGHRSVQVDCVWHAWQPASPATAASRAD